MQLLSLPGVQYNNNITDTSADVHQPVIITAYTHTFLKWF